VSVDLSADVLEAPPPQARWLDHRGRGHRALLQDPTSGNQPQPAGGTSDVPASDAAGGAGTQDPAEGEATALRMTPLGTPTLGCPFVWRHMRVAASQTDQRLRSGPLPRPW